MLTNGKNPSQGKNPLLGDFQITTLKNPVIKNQAVTSIRNLTITLDYPKIPTNSWTFTPIPNWTRSCRDFFLYARILIHVWLPSNWLIVVGCKVLHFKICWRSGNTRLQNPKVHKNIVASHKVNEFFKLSSCVFDDFKIKFLYALEI